MARTLKTRAATGAKAVKHGRPKGDGWRKVQRVSVETAALVQVSADHLVWRGPIDKEPDWLPQCHNMFRTQGAIVKLVPPPGTPESHVESLERSFYAAGAVSVKVMPTQEETKVTVEGEAFDFADKSDDRPLRQVVMERAERVTNAHDPGALKALLSEAMDHAEAT